VTRASSFLVVATGVIGGSEALAQPLIDIDAVMDCRAHAIAHMQVADFGIATFSEASARTVREQADFAMILGVWGAPLASVESASRDMNAGERLFIEKTRLVARLASAQPGPQGYSGELEQCVPVVWTAVKAVTDAMIQGGANRARLPE